MRHLAADEPFGFFFPVQRAAIESFQTRIAPIDDAPGLKADFESWSASRAAFHRQMAADPPAAPADKWQKLYYRGLRPSGQPGIDDHRIRLSICPFDETDR